MAFSSRRSIIPASNTSTKGYRSYPSNSNVLSREGNSTSKPTTARPRTAISVANIQDVICAVSESRGISPTVGVAFLNLNTAEAVLCQISDNQTYVRTLQKLSVCEPSEIIVPASVTNVSSNLYSIIEENLDVVSSLRRVDRRYWAETTGLEYIEQLAFMEDVEAIKTSIGNNYFAICSFAAVSFRVMKYVEFVHRKRFPFHSLRIAYQPSEGSMMVDISTIHSLELIQNIQNSKSKQCLFGLLNETLTPMGARLLRSNILQPSTDSTKINSRLDAVEELSTREEIFASTRQALHGFLDAEKILTTLITIPDNSSPYNQEQAVNRVIMLREFISSVIPVYEALATARSELLMRIRENCTPENLKPVIELIENGLNEEVAFAKGPLALRNQRIYAIKSGVDGLIDIARQAFKEAQDDAFDHVQSLTNEHGLPLELKFETLRQFHIRLHASAIEDHSLPSVFTNIIKKKNRVECQTLDLMKLNQRMKDCQDEILQLCDEKVTNLIENIRYYMSNLYKCCESIALLDMLASFTHLTTTQEYTRAEISDVLGIRGGRHPIRERFQQQQFIPNDIYATPQSRFQIITGCNMSGKSTYIRSIALMSVMMQIGCFVPASRAYLPIIFQLFARTSVDDNIEANVSTFAAEMREMSCILRNIDSRSLAIVDELGRGTSTRDGLCIALAISEALLESKALVWFVTHFKDLAKIMQDRVGVINLHMAVEMDNRLEEGQQSISMLYRIAEGVVRESHYGLAVARVFPLPPQVLQVAETVSYSLEDQLKRRSTSSAAVMKEKKRKLLLNLREHLEQAKNGSLSGEALRVWLMDLQNEFVLRMSSITEEAERARRD